MALQENQNILEGFEKILRSTSNAQLHDKIDKFRDFFSAIILIFVIFQYCQIFVLKNSRFFPEFREFERFKGIDFQRPTFSAQLLYQIEINFFEKCATSADFFSKSDKSKKNSSAVSISEKSSKLHFVFYNNHLNLKILKIDFLKDFFFEIKNNFSYLFFAHFLVSENLKTQ